MQGFPRLTGCADSQDVRVSQSDHTMTSFEGAKSSCPWEAVKKRNKRKKIGIQAQFRIETRLPRRKKLVLCDQLLIDSPRSFD
jgi:hypothetical protein